MVEAVKNRSRIGLLDTNFGIENAGFDSLTQESEALSS
jgi:hypothetical protein